MESWKRFLAEQTADVVNKINKEKIKDQFKGFIEKYKQQIPEIESIVDKYIDMKMKDKSTDYSDLADFVVKERPTKTPPPTKPAENPAEFDPTDHRNWRSDL